MGNVELIDNNSNGVLDLTGGSDGTIDTETTTSETGIEETGSTDTTETIGTGGEGKSDSVDVGSGNDVVDDTGVSDVDDKYFFGEEEVSIEVPDEISSALSDAGIDEKSLLTELFKKDGGFTLEGEMREKLDAKFGKLMVDGYLKMYKGLNDQSARERANETTDKAATFEKQSGEYAEAVGGIEGLTAMESFITDNFSDSQVSAYNAIMENEDHASQMLIIETVKTQMELQDKLTNGDSNISLLGDGTNSSKSASPLDKGYLTADEYQVYMYPENEYWTDKTLQSKVDAARSAGFKLNK